MNVRVASQSKRREGERYSRRLWNQNGQHVLNLCESNILETQVNYSEVNFLLKVQTT